ncbi:DUF4446 family protein [Actinoallomurus spadix]|uniref:DUF4446 family protein n=1 Tax=Actinoallomurus spadix TaxID=79912 RepID=A0ABN0WX35_9ACTN|nr:DUF4446 family protein [Actinoallomurus spadix]MCO5986697.1 DUF4446 family protein [Actinoallomurus spadix]
MILVTIALAAVGIGLLGLYAGLTARRRAAQAVEECVEMVRRRLETSADVTDGRAIRDVAIVHYDALREDAGGLSFSLALLNAAGDGVVLTSINGRTETRTYAKIVHSGRSLQLLSPEEDQVVRAARLGQGPQIRLDDGRDIGMNARPSPST